MGFIDPQQAIYFVMALLICLTIHECSHALIALFLGDPTARNLGRLSLNPMRHLDPLGTIFLVIMAFSGIGIGWAKPVPVNPHRMRISPKTGMAIVAIAGPVSTMVLAAVLFAATRVFPLAANSSLADFLSVLFTVSIFLAAFNLIPIPPLDGFNVLLGVLPDQPAFSLSKLGQYGPVLLLVLIMFPGVLSSILYPIVGVVQSIVTFGTL
jgi:Zn-dependent protease